MKNIKSLMLSAGMVATCLGVVSCQKTKTTEDGTEYTYIKEGSEKPENGQFVIYEFTAKNSKDSTFISSIENGAPAYMMHNDSVKNYDTTKVRPAIDEIMTGLRKGDSIQFSAAAKDIFGEMNTPPFLTAEEQVTLNIGVTDILDESEMQDFMAKVQEKQRAKMEKKAEAQLAEDIKKIQDYMAEHNINATKTESGLFYVIEEEGDGEVVEEGNTAVVNYTGYVLDGETIFDTSVEEIAKENDIFNEGRPYEPFEVMVGKGRVIPGWDEGLQLLKGGSKAKFLIPSTLAYGPRQAGEVIKPNSILVFDVEVVDVQK
ncbi:FKBP-type peptidyl-prolyl cis-trans isomerase [Echinicola vietnamensis]|uniref:Peptidyl-prolyl cis-trans isomerase n=1 Tax=Echinicola vietnamensis (strain DSM 17526 / LMG 23754 / KMM 6221) TaxID=926556 RepID=L0FTM2_ECHVK|nr:FKBP-type peptidyl-prolyl cis-trans isomerase [Echinicola vietnamensis]AGA77264.1 FKBP-type peptidyl-prolyl cis-trans isomerase [Echinicola vietnamensis DSM 17526]